MSVNKTKKEAKAKVEVSTEETPIAIPEPKMFSMVRKDDETGVSGKGRVLDGWVTHNGKVVICWRTDTVDSESLHGHSSLGLYESMKAFKLIHIDSHPDNNTELIWHELK